MRCIFFLSLSFIFYYLFSSKLFFYYLPRFFSKIYFLFYKQIQNNQLISAPKSEIIPGKPMEIDQNELIGEMTIKKESAYLNMLKKRGLYLTRHLKKIQTDFLKKYQNRHTSQKEFLRDVKLMFSIYQILIQQIISDLEFTELEVFGEGIRKLFQQILMILTYLIQGFFLRSKNDEQPIRQFVHHSKRNHHREDSGRRKSQIQQSEDDASSTNQQQLKKMYELTQKTIYNLKEETRLMDEISAGDEELHRMQDQVLSRKEECMKIKESQLESSLKEAFDYLNEYTVYSKLVLDKAQSNFLFIKHIDDILERIKEQSQKIASIQVQKENFFETEEKQRQLAQNKAAETINHYEFIKKNMRAQIGVQTDGPSGVTLNPRKTAKQGNPSINIMSLQSEIKTLKKQNQFLEKQNKEDQVKMLSEMEYYKAKHQEQMRRADKLADEIKREQEKIISLNDNIRQYKEIMKYRDNVINKSKEECVKLEDEVYSLTLEVRRLKAELEKDQLSEEELDSVGSTPHTVQHKAEVAQQLCRMSSLQVDKHRKTPTDLALFELDNLQRPPVLSEISSNNNGLQNNFSIEFGFPGRKSSIAQKKMNLVKSTLIARGFGIQTEDAETNTETLQMKNKQVQTFPVSRNPPNNGIGTLNRTKSSIINRKSTIGTVVGTAVERGPRLTPHTQQQQQIVVQLSIPPPSTAGKRLSLVMQEPDPVVIQSKEASSSSILPNSQKATSSKNSKRGSLIINNKINEYKRKTYGELDLKILDDIFDIFQKSNVIRIREMFLSIYQKYSKQLIKREPTTMINNRNSSLFQKQALIKGLSIPEGSRANLNNLQTPQPQTDSQIIQTNLLSQFFQCVEHEPIQERTDFGVQCKMFRESMNRMRMQTDPNDEAQRYHQIQDTAASHIRESNINQNAMIRVQAFKRSSNKYDTLKLKPNASKNGSKNFGVIFDRSLGKNQNRDLQDSHKNTQFACKIQASDEEEARSFVNLFPEDGQFRTSFRNFSKDHSTLYISMPQRAKSSKFPRTSNMLNDTTNQETNKEIKKYTKIKKTNQGIQERSKQISVLYQIFQTMRIHDIESYNKLALFLSIPKGGLLRKQISNAQFYVLASRTLDRHKDCKSQPGSDWCAHLLQILSPYSESQKS